MAAEETATPAERYDHKLTMEHLYLAFQQFAIIAKHIPDAEIEQAREAVSRAESIGFILDPTKYRDALQSGSLERQRELVSLFTDTKKRLKALFPEGWR